MATETKKTKKDVYVLAEARGINLSLFERDAYQGKDGGAPGAPMYKAEMAFTAGADVEEIENQMAEFLDKEVGPGAGDKFLNAEDGWLNPFIDGNLLAKQREELGKSGDAYKDKLVLRAKNRFNKDGADGPGGMRVFGPDLTPIGILEGNQSEVYNGCFGKIAATFDIYKDFPRRGDKGITVYMSAFQKTRDGTPLRAEGGGAPNPFKAVSGAGTGDTGGGVRRRRAG